MAQLELLRYVSIFRASILCNMEYGFYVLSDCDIYIAVYKGVVLNQLIR